MEASREDGGVFFRLPLWPRDQEVWPVPIADGAGYFHEHFLGVASLLKVLEELRSGCSECLDVRGGAKSPDDFSLDDCVEYRARMARLKVQERLWVRWFDVGFDVEDSLLCEPASFIDLEI